MNRQSIPRVRDQAILFPLTFPNVILWIGLTALAYAGNVAHVELSVNLEFLFGSIPVLVILHFFGWAPAVLSAALSSAHTAVLWHHPFGVIALTLEVLLIGMVYRRRSRNLLLLDTGFWVLLGIPLVLAYFRGVIESSPTDAFLTALQMAVNGIINALIASLVIAVVEQVIPRLRHAPTRKILGFAQAVFLAMVAFVLIPAMAILVVMARQEMTRVEEDVQTRLGITTFSARQAVSAWMAENLQTLHSLASFATPFAYGDTDRIRTEMRLLNMSDSDLSVLAVTDIRGRVTVAEPQEEAQQLLGGANLAGEPYFARMAADLLGVASDVVFRRESGSSPIVLLAVPIVSGDRLTGAVMGVLDTTRLKDLLNRVVGNWAVHATITDGNGVIIVSTSRGVPPFSSYDRQFPGPYRAISPAISVRVARGVPDGPLMQRWQNSEYSTRQRIGVISSWTISLQAPLAPYQTALSERYRTLLLVMLIVTIFTTLLSAFVSRRMLGSLIQLTAVAEGLPDKVVRQQEPEWPVSNIDEIHTLIQCFRITSQQLSETFIQLQLANDQLTGAKQQAELANRTKSEFLANISHDLRTPLNGILGYAQILARDTSLDDRTRNAVMIIRKSGNHLLNLINDILDVSRIEANKLHLMNEAFFLKSFLDDIADIVSLQARQKGLQLIVEFSAGLPPVVVGDEKRLRQVLLNLLNNAVKFTEKGHVRFSADFVATRLKVVVEDTGIGIPEEEQEAIFSPFKQLTKHIQSEEGTGLGLAIVRRLVSMMDGVVTVHSTPGRGSTFTLELNLPTADAVPPGPLTASTVTGYHGPVQSVLVVDDKQENRSVLRNMLEPLGFSVREAPDGVAGLEAMKQGPPDLVLMDLVMPRMDGFEAISAIRDDPELREVMVVAISASVASAIRDECLRVGFNDFLPKPFRDIDLLASIRRLLDLQWVLRHEDIPDVPETSEVLVPPLDELEELMAQIESGNIRGVVDAADALTATDERYRPFAGRIISMAQSFQINKLADVLERVRSGGSP